MSPSEAFTAEPIKPVQYSMRSLLVLMGVMAVVAAVAGSYYRQCTPEARPYLLILWSSSLSAMAGSFWYLERDRIKRIDGVGECMIRLPSAYYHFWASSGFYNWGGLLTFFFGTSLLFMLSLGCEQRASRGDSYLITAAHGLQMGIYLLSGFFLVRKGGDVRLCENGVLSKQRLIKWSDISRITPNLGTEHDDRTVYSLKGNPMFRVPPELREQVDALIKEKLKKP